MTVDQYWLDDAELARISRQTPSTSWGVELMSTAWPKLYPGLLSSDTYRGCAAVLAMLRAYVRPGSSILDIQNVIEQVDQSVKQSRSFPAGSDGCGGATLTTTNAWQRTESGLSPSQIAAAIESELIYVAQLFVRARQHELAGGRLA
jgi:hypothetical protein